MADIFRKKEVERISYPVECDECRGPLEFLGAGTFECRKCGNIMYSDYGKVRKYIEENGETSIPILERATGVPREVLEELVKEGTLYDPDEDVKCCRACGCAIEKGRYCKECALKVLEHLSASMKASEQKPVAERPSPFRNAKMHFLNKRKK